MDQKFDQQYDLSPEMRKMFEIKQKQRMETKEYYQKLLHNPYRPINDGTPFDPAMMRFNALNAYRHQIYKTTPKFYFKVIALFTPFALFYFAADYYKKQKEASYRSGLVRYEDRYKFYY